MKKYNINKINHVATDGITRLIKNTIDDLSKEEYKIWINYLKKNSDKEVHLGYSEHNLFICRKV